jgi:hypothetical protein
LEFFIGFYELFSIFNLVYGLFLLVKDPSGFSGDSLGTYQLIQMVVAAVSSLSFLTIAVFMYMLAKDVDALTSTDGSVFSYLFSKYSAIVLNFLFMDTVPVVGDYFYLTML